MRMRLECDQKTFLLEQDDQSNLHDIINYINEKLSHQGLRNFISSHSLTNDQFTSFLTRKSQGNFMYLRYVVPEIEHGYYGDLVLDKLPEGLTNYYEDHWRRMRLQSENAWFDYKLPVIIVLSIVKEPVSAELISEFSAVSDLRRIRSILHEWRQFLYEQEVPYEGGMQRRWRVYHDSFREFIASKDEVEGERVSLVKAHGYIADRLWRDLFGEE